jgi:hypothetical protein
MKYEVVAQAMTLFAMEYLIGKVREGRKLKESFKRRI